MTDHRMTLSDYHKNDGGGPAVFGQAIKELPSATSELISEAWAHPGPAIGHAAKTVVEAGVMGTAIGYLVPARRPASMILGVVLTGPAVYKAGSRLMDAEQQSRDPLADQKAIAHMLARDTVTSTTDLSLSFVGGYAGTELGSAIARSNGVFGRIGQSTKRGIMTVENKGLTLAKNLSEGSIVGMQSSVMPKVNMPGGIPKGAGSAAQEVSLRPSSDGLALAELGESRLPSNLTKDGVDLRYKVTADNQARQVTVHLPPGFNPDQPTSVYYLLDGVQINNPAGNMLGINGWARTADAHNIVAVNIEQAPGSNLRVFGARLPKSVAGKSIPNVTSWSFKHGLLNKTAGINDVQSFSSVYGRMQSSMAVKANNIVAFSDGAPLANAIAADMPAGSLNGVANVAGTIMTDAPLPKPDIKGFFVNSMHDPTIPLEGGPGPKMTKWLPLIGQRHILKSMPELQSARYAEANGLSPTPRTTETPVYTQKDYVTSAGDGEKVRAFVLKKGGHTSPGRDVGDGTSTALTKANGETVSRAEFPTNDRIVEFLESGLAIRRTL